MKKLFVALMLVLFVSSFSFAQINKGWDGTKPEVYKGSKYMTFMYTPFGNNDFRSVISGNFLNADWDNNIYNSGGDETATTITGLGIGMFATSNIALQLNLGLMMTSSDHTTTPQPPATGTTNTKRNSTMFGVGLEGDYHFKSLYSISPFIGIDVNLGMLSTKLEQTVTGNPTFTREFSSTGIYGGLNLGFDWYFTPGLSLGGKYTLGFATFGEPTYKEVNGATTTEVKGASSSSIGISSASIFLKVHF